MPDNIQLTDEELNQDLSPDTLDVIDDEGVKKTLQTEHARKVHFRNKFQETNQKLAEAQAELAKLKTPNAPIVNDKLDEVNNRLCNLELSETKRQFGSQHGFSAEETDSIFAYAKGIGKEPHTVIDDPFVKTAITAMRQTKANVNATPAPSGSTIVIEGKKWSDMSNDERRKNFDKVFQK